ncbi:MAG TPA: hypothetical protein VLA34_00920 [Candidatus Krumholzibacterium sp.]|nr:hypothetical protein [Candidatus Krumholzibacterium sp.]
MLWEADNERDERKQAFIARMRNVKSRELLDPLMERLLAFEQGETGPDEVFRAAAWAGRKGEALIGDFKKRPDVILAGIAMDENRYLTGMGDIGVSVRQAEVTGVFSDAIVIPAGPDASASNRYARSVIESGGSSIEEELKGSLPARGTLAVSTGPGELTAANIIHVFLPDGDAGSAITSGVTAALALAEELGSETVALAGFYLEDGDADRASAAAAVLDALKQFEGESVQKVILCDTDEGVVASWVELLEEYDEE